MKKNPYLKVNDLLEDLYYFNRDYFNDYNDIKKQDITIIDKNKNSIKFLYKYDLYEYTSEYLELITIL